MPKKGKLKSKISKYLNEDLTPVYKFEFGEIELSTLVQFKDESEELSFYEALDLCVEQKDSTDGVDELFNPEGRTLEGGEKITKQFNIVHTGLKKETLNDFPDVYTEEDFIEYSVDKSLRPGEPETVEMEVTLSAIASHLFKLNKHLVNKKLNGKMFFLFTAICRVCLRYESLHISMDSRRKIIANKVKTINDLFGHGLVTGKSWSSAPFWNAVRSDLMIEYDGTSETTTLSPFTEIFGHLNNIIKIEDLYRESLFNSILHILDTFKIFTRSSTYKAPPGRPDRRRQITDKFRNLPDHIPGPGVEVYTNQQKL